MLLPSSGLIIGSNGANTMGLCRQQQTPPPPNLISGLGPMGHHSTPPPVSGMGKELFCFYIPQLNLFDLMRTICCSLLCVFLLLASQQLVVFVGGIFKLIYWTGFWLLANLSLTLFMDTFSFFEGVSFVRISYFLSSWICDSFLLENIS